MNQAQIETSRELANHVREALDDGKAVDIRVLEVTAMTSITDFMIVASGRSSRQVKALTERLREAVQDFGSEVRGMEGQQGGEWVLVDLGDVVVHIMQPETRDFYQLEKLWELEPHTAHEPG